MRHRLYAHACLLLPGHPLLPWTRSLVSYASNLALSSLACCPFQSILAFPAADYPPWNKADISPLRAALTRGRCIGGG